METGARAVGIFALKRSLNVSWPSQCCRHGGESFHEPDVAGAAAFSPDARQASRRRTARMPSARPLEGTRM